MIWDIDSYDAVLLQLLIISISNLYSFYCVEDQVLYNDRFKSEASLLLDVTV